MSDMTVFTAPGVPDGWHRSEVVRVVDPLGLAVAWIAPAQAGACIGFSSRETTSLPWRSLLVSDSMSDRLACEVSCAQDEDHSVPLRSVASSSELSERDPTQVTVLVDVAGSDLFVRSRCDEGAFRFGWFWTVREPDLIPFRCLDVRLAHDRDAPLSVTRQMEVNGIDLTIRHAATSRY